MDKLEKANLNIEILIDELLHKEKEYLSEGYCPPGGRKSNYCEDGSCFKCKNEYLQDKKKIMLEKYLV